MNKIDNPILEKMYQENARKIEQKIHEKDNIYQRISR